MRKLGKQKNITSDNIIVTKYGTMNYENLKSVFISMKCWVEPNNSSYNKIISNITTSINRNIRNNIDKTIFYDSIILDIDLKESGFKLGKKSFMSIDVNLYLKNKSIKFNDKAIQENVIGISNSVNECIIKNDVKVFKSKK